MSQFLSNSRKQQIVIVGNGISVLAFCNKFRSKEATLTLISKISNVAPQVVRNGILAGHLNETEHARLLRVHFAGRSDITFVNDSVAEVDAKSRKLKLKNHESVVEYDFLLVANGDDEPEHHLSSIPAAMALKKQRALEKKGASVRLANCNTVALDLATALIKKPSMQLSNNTPEQIEFHEEPNSITFPNKPLSEDDISWLKTKLEPFQVEFSPNPADNDTALPWDTFSQQLPAWALPLCGTLKENQLADKTSVRPDLRLRSDERVYFLPELVEIKDFEGKRIPREDHAWIQQSNYLAKMLKSVVEKKSSSEMISKAFVLKQWTSLVTLKRGKSIGFVGSKLKGPGWIPYVIDVTYHRFPVFRTVYGLYDGILMLWKWLQGCK